jgi:hypothetical protein
MPNEGEVKIHVAGSADLQQIEAAQNKIKELYRAAAVYEDKGITTAAASARADARSLERDVARLTRERGQAERAITREMREQTAERRAGVGLLGALSRAGAGVLVSDVLGSAIEQMAAGESLGNRRTATGAANQRQLAVFNSIRGTSGQMQDEVYAAEDRMAERERNKPQLQTDQKFNTLSAAAEGGAMGAGIGAALGSVVPVLGTALGALLGAGLGAVVRGVPAYLQGGNKIAQSNQDQEQDADKLAKLKAQKEERFMGTEGGLALDALRGRSKRSLGGQREAFTAEMAGAGLAQYREAKAAGASDDIAKEMSDLTVQNKLRDRQAQAGAELVDAHTGGAGIAAAASWATRQNPAQGDVTAKLETLISVVNQGNQESQRVNHAK